MTLAELNKKIDQSGLTRYTISFLSGVSKSVLSNIKNKPNYDPTLTTVTKIIETIEKHGRS